MKQKIELLANREKWVAASYGTKVYLLSSYKNMTHATTTDKYEYYATNEGEGLLFRVARPPRMTKREAEEKYNIEIKN